MRILNIVPMFTGNIDYMVSEALRLHREIGLNEMTVCLSLHPQEGEISKSLMEKVMLYKQAFREYRFRLADSGIKVGALMQSLVGHGWLANFCHPEGWEIANNLHHKRDMRVCILNPQFKDYLYNTVKLIAEEQPDFMMTDDDLKQISASKNLECFCPLHIAQFNAGREHQMTAQELKNHIENATAGDEILTHFDDLRVQNLLSLANVIRSAIDAVNPDIPCYCSSPMYEFFTIGRLAAKLAGKNRQGVRIPNSSGCPGGYIEGDAKLFPIGTYRTQFYKSVMPEINDFFDETDTFPHSRYSKSAISLHAHITAAVLNGLHGSKLWITNLYQPDAYTSRKYEMIIKENLAGYSVLEKLVASAKPVGAITPLPLRESYEKIWNPQKADDCFFKTDWQFQILAHYGIPAYYGLPGDDGIHLLSGDMLRFFSDEQISGFFSHPLLIDGSAAIELAKRGFESLMGVTVKNQPHLATLERDYHTGKVSTRYSEGDCNTPIIQKNSEKTEIISEEIFVKYLGATHEDVVSCGVTYFENLVGGKIAIYAQSLTNWWILEPLRRQQLLQVLAKLNGRALECVVEADQDVFTRAFYLPDSSLLLAVFNLNFDTLENIILNVARPIANIKFLAGDGSLQDLDWIMENNIATVKKPLSIYEVIILKIAFI